LTNDSVAIVFPTPSHIANRLFNGKNIFIKYTPREKSYIKIGTKLMVYCSKPTKAIIGEGIIEFVEYLTPREVLEKYEESLMLNAEELLRYTNMRNRPIGKKLLVLKLTHLKKYRKALQPPPKLITMVGKELTKQEYDRLIRAV
jgi:hypothetical protein